MRTKKILIICIIILISSTVVFAHVYTSPNHRLVNPKIVVSGGKARSSNYSLSNVEIGNFFGGKAESARYSLDTNPFDERRPPAPPTLNPVTSPTNNPTQTLSGTKERGTSIYINGYEKVPLTSETTWSYAITLTEGNNSLIITAQNEFGLESESVSVTIILDTIPPLIIIDYPLDCTIVSINPIVIEGTIDGVPFSEARNLNFGLNQLTKEATDEAGNMSFRNIEVYLVRIPIAPPQ